MNVVFGGRPCPRLREKQIRFAPLAGQSLLFAADLHVREKDDPAAVSSLARALRGEGDEAVLLGGDLGEGPEGLECFLRALRREAHCPRVLCVRGNNDAFPEFCGMAEEAGIRVLRNESCFLSSGRLCVSGIDDAVCAERDWSCLPGAREGLFRIALEHFPALPPEGLRPDILLCGHTHGGQIRAFGIDPYAFSLELLYLKLMRRGPHVMPCLVRGEGVRGGVRVLVTNGIGTSRLPVRVNCPPEIVRLRFTE